MTKGTKVEANESVKTEIMQNGYEMIVESKTGFLEIIAWTFGVVLIVVGGRGSEKNMDFK